jgi:hypothetical protein
MTTKELTSFLASTNVDFGMEYRINGDRLLGPREFRISNFGLRISQSKEERKARRSQRSEVRDQRPELRGPAHHAGMS